MTIAFLPLDYEAPRAPGHYMKLLDGENRIRILTAPVLGWEDWQDNLPIRYRMDKKPAKPVDPSKPVKHFWAFLVWNYAEEKVQILQVVQVSIQRAIQALTEDDDWGLPYFYDLKIVRSGEAKLTKYQVNPVPHKATAPHIVKAFYEKPCNLEALFDHQDPFAPSELQTTGIFEPVETTAEKSDVISEADRTELYVMLQECPPDYRESISVFLGKYNIGLDLRGCPHHLVDKLRTAIKRKRDECKLSQAVAQ